MLLLGVLVCIVCFFTGIAFTVYSINKNNLLDKRVVMHKLDTFLDKHVGLKFSKVDMYTTIGLTGRDLGYLDELINHYIEKEYLKTYQEKDHVMYSFKGPYHTE